MKIEYIDTPRDIFIWCNIHQRRATKICVKEYTNQKHEEFCCDPKLGGILIPCQTEDLTGKTEVKK